MLYDDYLPSLSNVLRDFSDFHLGVLLHELWANLVGEDHVCGQGSLRRLDGLRKIATRADPDAAA